MLNYQRVYHGKNGAKAHQSYGDRWNIIGARSNWGSFWETWACKINRRCAKKFGSETEGFHPDSPKQKHNHSSVFSHIQVGWSPLDQVRHPSLTAAHWRTFQPSAKFTIKIHRHRDFHSHSPLRNWTMPVIFAQAMGRNMSKPPCGPRTGSMSGISKGNRTKQRIECFGVEHGSRESDRVNLEENSHFEW